MFNSDTVFLVVDDFEPMRKITANQLRSLGANNILTAPNGLEALRIINSQRVDVVLSDWNMPVMTGLELLKALRTDPKLKRLPFIMITAEAERTHIQQAIAHGVTDLLIKPYSPARLANRIEKAMSARTQNRPPRILPQPVSDPAKGGAHSEVEAATLQRLYKGKANAHERPSILIVDDTPDNLMLLSNLFKSEYRIHLAINGEKALKMCQSDTPPDLVLLDVMMPDMDGFEVLQKLREHPMSEGIPVIFVTAMTDTEARSKGLELGAVDYVTKPVDPATLKLRVRNFMRYIGLHKQLQASYDDMLEMAHLREDIEHITRHDLKAPLAGVIGIVRAMLGDGSASPTQTEQLHAIEQTTLEVMNMINLSSELFKIETHRFELHAQKVDIADLLQRTTALLGTTFASKQLHLALQQSAPPRGVGRRHAVLLAVQQPAQERVRGRARPHHPDRDAGGRRRPVPHQHPEPGRGAARDPRSLLRQVHHQRQARRHRPGHLLGQAADRSPARPDQHGSLGHRQPDHRDRDPARHAARDHTRPGGDHASGCGASRRLNHHRGAFTEIPYNLVRCTPSLNTPRSSVKRPASGARANATPSSTGLPPTLWRET